MTCTGTAIIPELEFIQSLGDREPDGCRGPLIEICFRPIRFTQVEFGLASAKATELIWSGFQPHASTHGLAFRLCAVHWLDIVGLLMARGVRQGRSDYMTDATILINSICRGCDWDLREISNLLRWQRMSLT